MSNSQMEGFLQLGIAPEGLHSLFEELERELEKRSKALLSLRNALWEMKGYLNESVSCLTSNFLKYS